MCASFVVIAIRSFIVKLVLCNGSANALPLYAVLGFDSPLRTAITISFIAYSTFFFTFCIFISIAFVSFVLRVRRFRKEDEKRAKNSLTLMRTIRAEMIELKKQKFNEERDYEEAIVAARSSERLQSTAEAPRKGINLMRERKAVRGGIQDVKRKPSKEHIPKTALRSELAASQREKIAKRQDEVHPLSPEVQTSQEHKSAKQIRSKKSVKISAQSRQIQNIHAQKSPLVLQATQSLESTGSTQKSIMKSEKKRTSTAPGVIRTGTSTTKPQKLKPSRRHRKRRGKKHKRSKNSTVTTETTEETIQSARHSIVPSPSVPPSRVCSISPALPSQKTLSTTALKPSSVQKAVHSTVAPQLLAQKTVHTLVRKPQSAMKAVHPGVSPESSVHKTMQTIAPQPTLLKNAAPDELPLNKTVSSISPAPFSTKKTIDALARSQKKTLHPTYPSRLQVQRTALTPAKEKEKKDDMNDARKHQEQCEDISLFTFSTPSEKVRPVSATTPTQEKIADSQCISPRKSLKLATFGKHMDMCATSRRSRLSSLRRGLGSQKTASRHSVLSSAKHGLSSPGTPSRLLSSRLSARHGLTSQKTTSGQTRFSIRHGLGSQKASSRRSRLSSIRKGVSPLKVTSRRSRLTSAKHVLTSQKSPSKQSGQKIPAVKLSTSKTQMATPEEAPTQIITRGTPVKTKQPDGIASRKQNQRRSVMKQKAP